MLFNDGINCYDCTRSVGYEYGAPVYGTVSENNTQRKNEAPGENPVPVPLHSPQII